MKNIAILFIFLCSLSASALPLTWRADWPDCKPVESLVHRGTDVELQPTWYVNGVAAATNGWTFTTYVQTNAVGQWFGPLPGAAFSHTNDVGAAFYSVMVRAQGADGGVNYTAFARFRMLDSPGFTPGELPLPAKVIDFADVTVLNAPWPDASITNGFVTAEAATNIAEAVAASATNALDVSLSSRLSQESRNSTNYTDSAIASATNNLASASSLTNYATRAELDAGWWSEWTILREGVDVTEQVQQPDFVDDDLTPYWEVHSILGERNEPVRGGADDSELTWQGYNVTDDTRHDYTATRHKVCAPVPTKPSDIGAADSNTVATISADLSANYYTIAETDDAIDAHAAYYITMNAEGDAFPDYAALTNTTVYYSGGEPRTPTRNDYAVVLADETHGTNEWRYIYTVSVVGGVTNGQWDAQYPIETNDYEALSNKPQINGVELSGNQSAATLGLATPSDIGIPAFSTTATYASGDLVVHNDAVWECQEPTTGPGEWNDLYWGKFFDLSTDATPTAKSKALMTSGGIKTAIDAEAQNATNAANYAVSIADTSYARFVTLTNVNQSVQFVTLSENDTTLSIELPATGETKDWIVYVLAATNTVLSLPPATWYMTDTANTNAIPAGMTAFYFSQMATGIYMLGRQELEPVTIQGN